MSYMYIYYRGGATSWRLHIILLNLVAPSATARYIFPTLGTIIRQSCLHNTITNTVIVCTSTESCQMCAHNLGSAPEVCDFSWAGQVVAQHRVPLPVLHWTHQCQSLEPDSVAANLAAAVVGSVALVVAQRIKETQVDLWMNSQTICCGPTGAVFQVFDGAALLW